MSGSSRCCCRPRCGVREWSSCIYAGMVIIIVSIIISIVFLVPAPHELVFTITDASLAEFDYSTTTQTALSYSLALNITIRNPNKKGGLYFDKILVIANYRDKTFSVVNLTSTPFYLGAKNVTVLDSIVLRGRQSLLFNERDVEKYDSETSYGVYSVDVKLDLRLRDVRFGKSKVGHPDPPEIECDKLEVPLRNGSTISSPEVLSFKATKCKNVYIYTSKDDNRGSGPVDQFLPSPTKA
ncbi:Protein YLS [Parasponia andersonii]|uniref:Protein YLS n=1 Tax=Parasponia andersonii TaxID=3476 RepID=A0A2P5B108_PARAD|nr:Protein YLS [Parasponia andersonii]